MGFFGDGLSKRKFVDEIRCDESNYLIWKWNRGKDEASGNSKGNRIRYGSTIRVKEGEVAVFSYRDEEEDEVVLDYIVGPYDGDLDPSSTPDITNLLGLAYGDECSFTGEVYFINMADIIQIKFAVPYFDVFDSEDSSITIPVAVRGTMSFNIANYKKFIALHTLDNFSVQDFKNQIKDSMIRYVKGIILTAPGERNIPIIQLERRIEEINQLVEEKIIPRFLTDFGVTVTAVDIAAIEINKASQGYGLLKDREISKNQGAGRGAGVSYGADDFAKMQTPPPVDEISFYLAKDGKPVGPFTLKELASKIPSGEFTLGTLVWSKGMKDWLVASHIDILAEMFGDMPEIEG